MHRKLSLFVGLILSLSFQTNAQLAQIRILGIAQDAGHPQFNCQQACCTASQTNHLVSCISLEIGNDVYLFDATPDLIEQWNQVLRAKPEAQLKGIFLTHAHIGHYTGLMHLGKEAAGLSQIPVFAMPRMYSFIAQNGPWSQLVELKNIELKTLTNEQPEHISDSISVTPILVPHRDEFSETVGYEIHIGKHSVLYIPDIDKWEKWNRDIVDEVKRVDLALIDATFYDGNELPNRDMSEIPHPFVVESMNTLKDLPVSDKSKVVFIHLNHTNPLLNTSSKAFEEVKSKGFNTAIESRVFDF